ncbi:tagaturonate epimerase family protein [Pirellulaceae bacterium SH501]
MLTLSKYSFGVGDRFAHQAKAQLAAFQQLEKAGCVVAPVWNKSNREHNFVGSEPPSVLAAAQAAVQSMGWKHAWHVDADHIQLATVDRFLDCSDFFTIDVADSIGKPASEAEIDRFVDKHPELHSSIRIEGIAEPLALSKDFVRSVAAKYLLAVKQASQIYQHIASKKGSEHLIAEVSMDETDAPQTPPELLVILAALADEKIPLQTIAPKFTGRFNKGVDYVGDLRQFEMEFRNDIAVLAHCIDDYSLPSNLKLSVHSGSDKFSLYPIIGRCLKETGAGIHVKTAGTTWLEEVIGLAEAGGDGLELAKEMYSYAYEHVEELCAPYASVIDIQVKRLPSPQAVHGWTGPQFAETVRHIPSNPQFCADMRQLLHVSFKLAAKAGKRYTDLLVANEVVVAEQVTTNLWQRHLRPLFVDA